MRKVVLLLTCFSLGFAMAQTFTESSSLYSVVEPRSGGPVGVADMDGDGYDDIILLQHGDSLYIDYQESDGSFTNYYYGQVSTANQWGMAVGDVDNDGHKDVLCGGAYDGVHFVEIDSRGVSTMSDLANGNMFVQGANMVDINNDGWLDAFACHDDAESRIWGNDGTGALVPQNAWIDMTTTPISDNSGNYGSVWSDFDDDGDIDLYIAKCRLGVSNSADPRRVNALFVNDGNGNFSEQAAPRGLVVNGLSWTSDFADIDNDGDLDCLVTNHDQNINLLENNGNGVFTDISSGSGLEFTAFWLQALFEDFDNDGFVDLLITGNATSANPEADRLFSNNGDKTFTEVISPFPYPDANEIGHTFGLGDLNHDGFVDVFMSFGGGFVSPDSDDDDALFLNDGNGNHFLSVELEGLQSNRDGVGAMMKAYGPWGTMMREVRSGESYGIVSAFTQTFGLGTETTVDSLVVLWPSGEKDKLSDVAADQFLKITEGETAEVGLTIQVMLEGPYDSSTGLMGDALRAQGFIPLTEPFTTLGFNHIEGGGETIDAAVLTATGDDAVVDWVFVELRNKNNSSEVVATRSALVQRDGDVVDVDGLTALNIALGEGDFIDEFYVAVRHRNHLACMTSAAVGFDLGVATNVDLTVSTTTTYGTDARKDVSGTMVLWTGNVIGDDLLKYTGLDNDRDPILIAVGGSIPTATITGYLLADVTMDGIVKYTGQDNDRDVILLNIGGSVPTYTRQEQLP